MSNRPIHRLTNFTGLSERSSEKKNKNKNNNTRQKCKITRIKIRNTMIKPAYVNCSNLTHSPKYQNHNNNTLFNEVRLMQTKLRCKMQAEFNLVWDTWQVQRGKLIFEFFNYACVHFCDNICIDCSFRQNLVLCEELHENIPKLQL